MSTIHLSNDDLGSTPHHALSWPCFKGPPWQYSGEETYISLVSATITQSPHLPSKGETEFTTPQNKYVPAYLNALPAAMAPAARASAAGIVHRRFFMHQ
tara:strand:+ start:432 stop:728 length:297 start_codon:yes stop_codon:yes gene_type:complete